MGQLRGRSLMAQLRGRAWMSQPHGRDNEADKPS